MNKLIRSSLIITLGALFTLSAPVFAEGFQDNTTSSQGGFVGPKTKTKIMDVISALNARDDTKVTLTGHILSSKGDEDYTFQDHTGKITIEVDDHVWKGRTVTPETKIVIYGEVDKEWNEVSVDVDEFKIVK